MAYYNVTIEQEVEDAKGNAKTGKVLVIVEGLSTEEVQLKVHKEYEGTMSGFEIVQITKTKATMLIK